MTKDTGRLDALPDELLSLILEAVVKSPNFLTYQDLCSISMSCRRLRRLSSQDSLWSPILSSDFPPVSVRKGRNYSPSNCKYLYRVRPQQDREKKRTDIIQAIGRKESQIVDQLRILKGLESSLLREVSRLRSTSIELSNLLKSRQSAAALNVWQPHDVRVWQRQVVERTPVDAESRIRSLEMQLKGCEGKVKECRKIKDRESRKLDAYVVWLDAYKSKRDGGP